MLLENIDKGTRATLKVLSIFLNISVAILMVTEIIGRVFFSHSIRGLPEIYLLLAMWLYMIGAGLASANNTHLRIWFLDNLIQSSRGKRFQGIVTSGLTLIITFYFVWWALGLMRWALERPQTTPILMLPWLTSQASIMVASLLVAAYALRDFIKALTGGSRTRDHSEKGK